MFTEETYRQTLEALNRARALRQQLYGDGGVGHFDATSDENTCNEDVNTSGPRNVAMPRRS